MSNQGSLESLSKAVALKKYSNTSNLGGRRSAASSSKRKQKLVLKNVKPVFYTRELEKKKVSFFDPKTRRLDLK